MDGDGMLRERMRGDWNRRAQEDAYYYVAFGRKNQPRDEFLSGGRDLASEIMLEFPKLPKPASTLRVLEIGCGPGRLMRQLAPEIGEIHGVDVSDEMIRLAREHLADLPNAHVHVGDGTSLNMFGDSLFDLVYSYLVFQHIPDKNVVFNYLQETHRVLMPDGVFRGQFKGWAHGGVTDTWNGIVVTSEELREFCRAERFQLLALEGIDTYYLCTTWRKIEPGIDGHQSAREPIAIRGVTTSNGADPIVPVDGPDSWFSIWIDNLPLAYGLEHLSVRAGYALGECYYLGPLEYGTLRQVNVLLPPGMPLGPAEFQLFVDGTPAGGSVTISVVPGEPLKAKVRTITDAIDLAAGSRINTRSVKALVDHVTDPNRISIRVSGERIPRFDLVCIDPRHRSYDISFSLPDSIRPGSHRVEVGCGPDMLGPFDIEVER